MNARVVELETSPHQRMQKLLPWAGSGRLSEAEERLVQEHLAQCAECREDLAWQERLKAIPPEAGAVPDLEGALERLLPRLEAQAPARTRTVRPGWMMWALAAQFVLIAGLGVALAVRQQPAYQLLGSATLPAAGEANLIAVFDSQASVAQVQAALAAAEAQVVAGPTVAQAWLLRVAPGRVERSAALLRRQDGVKMAEPMQVKGAQ
jgi:anti-sigma factor RsiW